MTESYRQKLEEAAYRYRELCPHPDAWATFIAGAQFVLDNPTEEWVKKSEHDRVSNEFMVALFGVHILIEKIDSALNDHGSRPSQALAKIREALSPFQRGEK